MHTRTGEGAQPYSASVDEGRCSCCCCHDRVRHGHQPSRGTCNFAPTVVCDRRWHLRLVCALSKTASTVCVYSPALLTSFIFVAAMTPHILVHVGQRSCIFLQVSSIESRKLRTYHTVVVLRACGLGAARKGASCERRKAVDATVPGSPDGGNDNQTTVAWVRRIVYRTPFLVKGSLARLWCT